MVTICMWWKRLLLGLGVVVFLAGSLGAFRFHNPIVENNINVNSLGLFGPEGWLIAQGAVGAHGGVVVFWNPEFKAYGAWFPLLGSLPESVEIMQKIESAHSDWIVTESPVNVLAVEPTR